MHEFLSPMRDAIVTIMETARGGGRLDSYVIAPSMAFATVGV